MVGILDVFLWGVNNEQKAEIEVLKGKHSDDLKSWTIFTVVLPLITFSFAAATSLIYSNTDEVKLGWGKIFNNGSLPIIAFGIMSSSLPYMVEKLTLSNKDTLIYILRKRLVALVAAVMFLASGLFIIQSLSFIKNNQAQNAILLVGGLIVTFWATILGRVMFLTQSVLVEKKDVTDEIVDNVKDQQAKLSEQYPTDESDD